MAAARTSSGPPPSQKVLRADQDVEAGPGMTYPIGEPAARPR